MIDIRDLANGYNSLIHTVIGRTGPTVELPWLWRWEFLAGCSISYNEKATNLEEVLSPRSLLGSYDQLLERIRRREYGLDLLGRLAQVSLSVTTYAYRGYDPTEPLSIEPLAVDLMFLQRAGNEMNEYLIMKIDDNRVRLNASRLWVCEETEVHGENVPQVYEVLIKDIVRDRLVDLKRNVRYELIPGLSSCYVWLAVSEEFVY